MMKRELEWAGIIVGLIALVFAWQGCYEFHDYSGMVARCNRFTGKG
jgi:hypothetical protein